MTLEEWEAKHAPRLRSAVIDHMSAYNLIAWPDDEPETREDFIRAVLISVRDQLGNVARNINQVGTPFNDPRCACGLGGMQSEGHSKGCPLRTQDDRDPTK